MNNSKFSYNVIVSFLNEQENAADLKVIEEKIQAFGIKLLKERLKKNLTPKTKMGDLFMLLNYNLGDLESEVLNELDPIDFMKLFMQAKEENDIAAKAATKPNNKWVKGISEFDTKVLNYLRFEGGEHSVKKVERAFYEESLNYKVNVANNMNIRNSLNRLVTEGLVYRRTIDHDTRKPKRNCYEYSAL